MLGNVVMLAVDEALAGHVLGHVRYMDDSWLYLRSEDDWPEVYDIYRASASTLGLEANTSKVAFHSKDSGAAEDAMQHGHIAYLLSGAAGYRTPQMAAEDIQLQLDREEPDWALIGFHLGSLRYHKSIKIDHDWLIERITASHTTRSLAGQLQACRVASRLRLNKEHGQRLEELAVDNGLRRHTPLQAWAARAWGHSKAHRPGRAVDYACHYGDFTVRRAFALTIQPDSSNPSKRSCWRRKMRSVDPDLAPTLARLQ